MTVSATTSSASSGGTPVVLNIATAAPSILPREIVSIIFQYDPRYPATEFFAAFNLTSQEDGAHATEASKKDTLVQDIVRRQLSSLSPSLLTHTQGSLVNLWDHSINSAARVKNITDLICGYCMAPLAAPEIVDSIAESVAELFVDTSRTDWASLQAIPNLDSLLNTSDVASRLKILTLLAERCPHLQKIAFGFDAAITKEEVAILGQFREVDQLALRNIPIENNLDFSVLQQLSYLREFSGSFYCGNRSIGDSSTVPEEQRARYAQLKKALFENLSLTLRVLDASSLIVQDSDFDFLTRFSLENLTVSSLDITGAKFGVLPTSLKVFHCGGAAITDAAIEHLSHLDQLEELDLTSCGFVSSLLFPGSASFTGATLHKLPVSLQRLIVVDCDTLDPNHLDALQKARPNLRIIRTTEQLIEEQSRPFKEAVAKMQQANLSAAAPAETTKSSPAQDGK